MLITSNRIPPLKRKFVGLRKQQMISREGGIFRNRPRHIDQDIIGVRRIVARHLQVVNIVNDSRKVIVIPFDPFPAVVPRSVLISRKLRLTAIRLNRKRKGIRKGRNFHRLVRLVMFKVRGILRPCLRIAVPVGLFDIGGHEFDYGAERVANVSDIDRILILRKGYRRHRESNENNQPVLQSG